MAASSPQKRRPLPKKAAPPRNGRIPAPSRAQPEQASPSLLLPTEVLALDTLHPHPRNYQGHPDDELDHIMESLREHGFYRPIVIARDNTILALHGVWTAARKMGLTHGPVLRKDYAPDDPRALKLVIADNEIRHLADRDDRLLSEMLRELADLDQLLGTGYDEMMLANLAMVTRPAAEIADLDAAAQWVGMPEYADGSGHIQLIVNFATEEDRQEFCRMLGVEAITPAGAGTAKSIWWPKRIRDDLASLRFTDREADDE